MTLMIHEDAAEWFINEMDLEQGDYVQFFPKIYGGIPTAHPNYFLGITVGKNGSIGIQDNKKGIVFYFTEDDAWFLEAYDLEVVADGDDVSYLFHER